MSERPAIKGLEKVARERREMIAAQVRTSTGYTQGHVVGGLAAVVLLAPSHRQAEAAMAEPAPQRAGRRGGRA